MQFTSGLLQLNNAIYAYRHNENINAGDYNHSERLFYRTKKIFSTIISTPLLPSRFNCLQKNWITFGVGLFATNWAIAKAELHNYSPLNETTTSALIFCCAYIISAVTTLISLQGIAGAAVSLGYEYILANYPNAISTEVKLYVPILLDLLVIIFIPSYFAKCLNAFSMYSMLFLQPASEAKGKPIVSLEAPDKMAFNASKILAIDNYTVTKSHLQKNPYSVNIDLNEQQLNQAIIDITERFDNLYEGQKDKIIERLAADSHFASKHMKHVVGLTEKSFEERQGILSSDPNFTDRWIKDHFKQQLQDYALQMLGKKRLKTEAGIDTTAHKNRMQFMIQALLSIAPQKDEEFMNTLLTLTIRASDSCGTGIMVAIQEASNALSIDSSSQLNYDPLQTAILEWLGNIRFNRIIHSTGHQNELYGFDLEIFLKQDVHAFQTYLLDNPEFAGYLYSQAADDISRDKKADLPITIFIQKHFQYKLSNGIKSGKYSSVPLCSNNLRKVIGAVEKIYTCIEPTTLDLKIKQLFNGTTTLIKSLFDGTLFLIFESGLFRIIKSITHYLAIDKLEALVRWYDQNVRQYLFGLREDSQEIVVYEDTKHKGDYFSASNVQTWMQEAFFKFTHQELSNWLIQHTSSYEDKFEIETDPDLMIPTKIKFAEVTLLECVNDVGQYRVTPEGYTYILRHMGIIEEITEED